MGDIYFLALPAHLRSSHRAGAAGTTSPLLFGTHKPSDQEREEPNASVPGAL